jgi:hypothetical protein
MGTVALGVANLVGVVVLGRLLADPQARRSSVESVVVGHACAVLEVVSGVALRKSSLLQNVVLQVQYSLARSSLAFVGGSLPLLQVRLSRALAAPLCIRVFV